MSVHTLTIGKQGFLKSNNFRKLELETRVLCKRTESVGSLARPMFLAPSPVDVLRNRLQFAKHLHLGCLALPSCGREIKGSPKFFMSRNDEFLVSQNRAHQDSPLPLSAILRSGIQGLVCSYSASEAEKSRKFPGSSCG